MDTKKKMNDAREAYVKGNEIASDARKIYMANPKFKNASRREKGRMKIEAERQATDNHMFREFGPLYKPSYVASPTASVNLLSGLKQAGVTPKNAPSS